MKDKDISNYKIFQSFLIAGTFTFAGGLAMLPVLKEKFVKEYEVIEEDDFMHYAALAQSIPGIIGVNFGCLIGNKLSGAKGALIATLGTIFPAFILMLIATVLYVNIPQDGIISYVFMGVRIASASCIVVAGVTMFNHLKKKVLNYVIVAICLILILVFGVSSPYIIIGFGIIGILFLRGKI